MSEWVCIQVDHHGDVGPTIMDMENKGWKLHTYSTAGAERFAGDVKHYLLFER